jgi:protein involved in polysaccharide export with SLBB domain
LYNQVKVAGVPLPLLKEKIATFLRRYQRDPQLEVEPLFKVSVTGEVKSPGIYLVPPETTVADAVARAGGKTDYGAMDQATVLREGQKISVSLSETAAANTEKVVESGDQISVPHRRSFVGGVSSVAPLIGVTASLLSILFVVLSHR